MAKLYFISFFILVSTIVSAESEIEDLIVTGSFIKKNSQGPLPLESINNDEYRKLNISHPHPGLTFNQIILMDLIKECLQLT